MILQVFVSSVMYVQNLNLSTTSDLYMFLWLSLLLQIFALGSHTAVRGESGSARSSKPK